MLVQTLGFVISCGFQIHEIIPHPHSLSPRNNFTPQTEEAKAVLEEAAKPHPHEKAEPLMFLPFIGYITRKLGRGYFR